MNKKSIYPFLLGVALFLFSSVALAEVYNCGGEFKNFDRDPPAGCESLSAQVGKVAGDGGNYGTRDSVDSNEVEGFIPVRTRFQLSIVSKDRFFSEISGFYEGNESTKFVIEQEHLPAAWGAQPEIEITKRKEYRLNVSSRNPRKEFKFSIRTPKIHYEHAYQWVIRVDPPVDHTYVIPKGGGEARYAEPQTTETLGVARVLDGDTFEAINASRQTTRVRLHGIDAPEDGQEYGDESTQALKRLIANKIVKLEVTDKDRYGRSVAKVYVDSTYVNLEMVKQGMAWWYEKYAPKDYDLSVAQVNAQKKRVGLWSQQDPIPPWVYRQINKGR